MKAAQSEKMIPSAKLSPLFSIRLWSRPCVFRPCNRSRW